MYNSTVEGSRLQLLPVQPLAWLRLVAYRLPGAKTSRRCLKADMQPMTAVLCNSALCSGAIQAVQPYQKACLQAGTLNWCQQRSLYVHIGRMLCEVCFDLA